MPTTRIEIIEKHWSIADFYVKVARLPLNIIEQKLAILSNGTGLLSFDEYDRFLGDSCLLETDRVITFLNSTEEDPEKTYAATTELKQIIIEVNPFLNPELLVVTREGLIKVPDQNETTEDVQRLVDNPNWTRISSSDDSFSDVGDFYRELLNSQAPNYDMSQQSPVRIEPVKWEGLWFIIRKFEKHEVVGVFSERQEFNDLEQYEMYIVVTCLAEFPKYFIILDSMGLTEKYGGAEGLTHELYKLCIEKNGFLDWNTIDLKRIRRIVNRRKGKNSLPSSTDVSESSEEEIEEEFLEFEDVSSEEILELPCNVKKVVIGQDEAVDIVCDSIKLASCDLKEPNVPIGVFLFTGSTGTGKTWLAKMLCKELCGDEYALVRIDCSEYSQPHEVTKLTGAPASYIGYDDGGQLTNAILKRPFTVVLFDEIEKAHPRLHHMLLQINDEGRLTSGKGETVFFGQTVIIMTSNIGVEEIEKIKGQIGFGDVGKVTRKRKKNALNKALKNTFRPEFLNRIDAVLTFNDIEEEQAYKIIELRFDTLNSWLKHKNIGISYTDSTIKYLYEKGFDKEFGARPLNRAMKKEVMLPLSKLLLEKEIESDCGIEIDCNEDELTFSVVPIKEEEEVEQNNNEE
ncbi:MAG TPA: ATP-dependent Clp protease ATP-binding subunit [bacterium]|nr:ATP-dependent Clp protease ATP-binding subunit [bacterium]